MCRLDHWKLNVDYWILRNTFCQHIPDNYSEDLKGKKVVPSVQTCYQMIEEMGMLPHIVTHSEQVCRVALCLVGNMQHSSAIRLDRDLVQAAALLHDITKTRSFETREDHALTGKELLTERGFPAVAQVVGQHVHLENYVQGNGLDEAQVVNYADKRVLHDEVVSLEKRMEYIVKRYGQEETHRERIMLLWQQSRRLEEHLFSNIDFSPEELTSYL